MVAMPEPQADPKLPQIRAVATHALMMGMVITVAKFAVFVITDSVAVLSDALESIINIAAAGMVLYLLWLANRPADPDHPYGHGKAEVLAVGLEGWMILFSGLFIFFEAIRRLIFENHVKMESLTFAFWCLTGIGIASAILAVYVYSHGRRLGNATLIADGKHLLTDVASTAAVMGGLVLVNWTGKRWLDPVVALGVAGFIFLTSWRLLWQSVQGIMDKTDPEDEKTIRRILDEEIERGSIKGYHKVRYRHTGSFHWVDMHLQVDGATSVTAGHDLASGIERRIEEALGEANATAHLEPWDPDHVPAPESIATGAAASEPSHTPQGG